VDNNSNPCCAVLCCAAQLLETSGVADVEPLASLLTSSGFKLAGVVAVVDAEAGSSQLQGEEVALAQVGGSSGLYTCACLTCASQSVEKVSACLQEWQSLVLRESKGSRCQQPHKLSQQCPVQQLLPTVLTTTST
jgi:G3E family GTPase